MEYQIRQIGNEDLDGNAMGIIDEMLYHNEAVTALAGFDFETKVIAVTDQRIIIASRHDGLVLNLTYNDTRNLRRDGRTLYITDAGGTEHRHRFGNDDTVEELVNTINQQRQWSRTRRTTTPTAAPRPEAPPQPVQAGQSTPISERVKFWEEQDRINQELIPRVIRQHNLLNQHLSDHEMLPIVAATAAREAVAEARNAMEARINESIAQAQEENRRNLEEAIAQSQAEAERNLEQAIARAQTENQRQAEEAIARAQEENRRSLEEAIAQSQTEAERNLGQAIARAQTESQKQLEEAIGLSQAETQRVLAEAQAANQESERQLTQSKAEREEQRTQYEAQLTKLRQENRTARIIGIVAGAAAIAAIVIAVVL